MDVKPNACGCGESYGTAKDLAIGPAKVCAYDKTAHKPLKLLTISDDKPATTFGTDQETLAHFASACALIAKGRAIHNTNICLLWIVDKSQSISPAKSAAMRFGGKDGRISVSIGTWQIDRDSAETYDHRLCHAIEDDGHIRLVGHLFS
ncbi:hypothetical protein ACC817_06130 [Rhizobium ruizarguesonis]|uniref:hypothetical protein n=1 Tax=Rhizobium ruizarguesonis TaxID=2081791 RepID=UPI0013EE8AC0|nr:hypothetical protein [Rhizobium ruizarguesonis]